MVNAECSVEGCEGVHRLHAGMCGKHYTRWRKYGDVTKIGASGKVALPASVRFFQRVKLDRATGCWRWQLKPTPTTGYGTFRDDEQRTVMVHRFAYELLVGPIPEGEVVDHECHNRDPHCAGGRSCLHRLCCNPAHLGTCSLGANVLRGKGLTAQAARQTHCKKGHPFSGDNLFISPTGQRQCRICKRYNFRRWYWRQQGQSEKVGVDRKIGLWGGSS